MRGSGTSEPMFEGEVFGNQGYLSLYHISSKIADLHLQILMAGISVQNVIFRVWWMIMAKITHSKCQNQECPGVTM